MAVALAVIQQGLALQRVLDLLDPDPAARRPRGLDGALQRGQRHARVPSRPRGQHLQRLVRDRGRVGDAALVRERAAQQGDHVLGRQRPELVDLGPGEQRRVDLEVGVLGGGADQRQQAILDRRQQGVLLGLVEAVDLVEEEDRRPAGRTAFPGALDDLPHLGAAGVDGRELLEGARRSRGDDPGQGRLAGPRRPVEDRAVRLAGFDRDTEGRPRLEQLALADELVQLAGAHPRRERGGGAGAGPGGRRRLGLEQSFLGHQTSMSAARRQNARRWPPRAPAPIPRPC